MDRVTDAALRRQRQVQTILVIVILATLPCYCLGSVLLIAGGNSRPGRTPTPVPLTLTGIGKPTLTLFPSITPITLNAPIIPTNPIIIQPTPTQIFLFPTTPAPFPTFTWTPFQAPSLTPTIPPIIIITPITPTPPPPPTPLPPPTLTPPLPSTLIPSLPTATETATNTPPGFEPTPTRAGSA